MKHSVIGDVLVSLVIKRVSMSTLFQAVGPPSIPLEGN